ncbi:hypothetical protein [Niallia circulans]|uniref:Uncharacterized protein n=1 Tax=Niallia circulans TaxID=1397 RepID=A0A941G8L7_NIACI|nr:hypothetical protein [Niallia circulans]MCB5235495.1 hypothetical protein [Niallia circulans]
MSTIEKTSLSEVLSMYRELQEETEYYETLLKEINVQWKINYGLLAHNPSPNGGGYIPVAMDITAGHMDKLMDRYKRVEKALEINKRLMKVSEDLLKRFDGLKYKVAYARFVEGKSLMEIAVELNYSYDHIRRVMSKINKNLEKEEATYMPHTY